MKLNKIQSIIIVIAAMTIGCGTSDFGSTGVEKSTDTDSKAEKSESADESKNQSANTDPELDEIGDLGSDKNKAKNHTAESEGEAEGCSYPDDVAAAVKNGSGTAFGLGDWGGTGSGGAGLNLKNLDLNDCEWFGLVKQEAKPRYLLIVNRGENSFVEPWSGEVTALNFAQCLTKAASLNSLDDVEASCQFAPIEKK